MQKNQEVRSQLPRLQPRISKYKKPLSPVPMFHEKSVNSSSNHSKSGQIGNQKIREEMYNAANHTIKLNDQQVENIAKLKHLG